MILKFLYFLRLIIRIVHLLFSYSACITLCKKMTILVFLISCSVKVFKIVLIIKVLSILKNIYFDDILTIRKFIHIASLLKSIYMKNKNYSYIVLN